MLPKLRRGNQVIPRIAIAARRYHPVNIDSTNRGIIRHSLDLSPAALSACLRDVNAIPIVIPVGAQSDQVSIAQYTAMTHALVLQGGSDIHPYFYTPPTALNSQTIDEKRYDKQRDDWEIKLFNAFLQAGKPILGICRGMQLINVALGGSITDIEAECSTIHDNSALHNLHTHEVNLVPSGYLHKIYGLHRGKVNSIHRQKLNVLSPHLRIEALCAENDPIIEAISLAHSENAKQYVMGVQWHPELCDTLNTECLSAYTLWNDFVTHAADTRCASTEGHQHD